MRTPQRKHVCCFLATLFQPELAGDGSKAHPIIKAFTAAASQRSTLGD